MRTGMSTSIVELEIPAATRITSTDDTLTVELADGRTISVPMSWHPRLTYATPEERDNWELYAAGEHIHWPDLDEDISVEALLAGKPSGESQASFQRWLNAKQAGRSVAYSDLMSAKRAQERIQESGT